MLLLDAKLEQGTLSRAEEMERYALKNAAKAAIKAAKSTVEKIIIDGMQRGGEISNEFMDNLAEEMQEYGFGVFDKARYETLREDRPCDGERGMATLR